MVSSYAFSASLAAMRAQSKAMELIGHNVSNVSTSGFKTSSVQFHSMVNSFDDGSTTENYSGVRPSVKRLFDKPGQVAVTNRNLDAAMLGDAFFITSTTPSAGGTLSLTKAGQFNGTVAPNSTTSETYLTDIAGNYVLGWPYDTATNTFTTGTSTASLQPIRVDLAGTQFAAVASTTGTIDANIPASDAVGTARTISLPIVDGTGDADGVSDDRNVEVTWTKTGTNTWDVTFAATGGTVTAPAAAMQMTFDTGGLNPTFTATSSASQAVAITWATPAGATSNVTLDLSNMTQWDATETNIRDITANGNRDGFLQSVAFNNSGMIMGEFSNGQVRPLAKVAAASVTNSNGLNPIGSTHFEITDAAGQLTLREPDQTQIVTFIAGGYESSDTQLAQEVTKMIQTQRAYSSAATSLRTVDEMSKTATELK